MLMGSNLSPFLDEKISAIHKITIPTLSTLEEKLEAVAYMGSIPTQDSVNTLNEALNMVEIPLSGSSSTKATDFRGGLLIYQAAYSLAINPNPIGIKILIENIKDRESHPFLREACVYGLGKIHKYQAYDALLLALNDPEEPVRTRSLMSIKNTLESNSQIPLRELNKIQEALCIFYLKNNRKIDTKDTSENFLARYLIVKYKNPIALMLLKNTLNHNNNIVQKLMALEILIEMDSVNIENILLPLLISKNQHPDLYVAIGGVLGESNSVRAKNIASKIVNQNFLKLQILSFLLPTYGLGLLERYKASLKILGF